MKLSPLSVLSPIDGRYANKTNELTDYFSEYALIRTRLFIEIQWLHHLYPDLSAEQLRTLNSIHIDFNESSALKIKNIESRTNHDIKAIEYYLREAIEPHHHLKFLSTSIHFGCTSDDISNLAYGIILAHTRTNIVMPALNNLLSILKTMSHKHAACAMLGRTHGQPASPTTLGKEFANVAWRLKDQIAFFTKIPIYGKMNGAVGNFNAHLAASPERDWPAIAKGFVEKLGLVYQSYTTQIEPRDYIATLAHNLIRINSVLIDFCRDIWSYMSIGYLNQNNKISETGSSTMPHKVNPIDFENAEGNFYIANALFNCFAEKLPISRWQRDLVDSTIQRNYGIAFGHALVGYKTLLQGLQKLIVNEEVIRQDLNNHWEILAEPIQMKMRAHNIANGYEKLKDFTKGKRNLTREEFHAFIDQLFLTPEITSEFKELTPESYLGNAVKFAKTIEY